MKELHSTLCAFELPTGSEVAIRWRRFIGEPGPRVALVAGVHGDTPEGIRVLHEVTLMLQQVTAMKGTVDLFPCVNPLAAHRGSRRWPFFDVDLNHRFPGRADGHLPDRIAHHLVNELRDADLVVQVRGAEPAVSEITQAHVRNGFPEEARLAMHTNVSLVWERTPDRQARTTLAAQFPNVIILEGGRGNWLTARVGADLAAGIMNLLAFMDIIAETHVPVHWAALNRARHVTDSEVDRVRVENGGFFLPAAELGEEVAEGSVLGRVVDPTVSEEIERVLSPSKGRIIAIREQPLVYTGSMVARVVRDAGGPADD